MLVYLVLAQWYFQTWANLYKPEDMLSMEIMNVTQLIW